MLLLSTGDNDSPPYEERRAASCTAREARRGRRGENNAQRERGEERGNYRRVGIIGPGQVNASLSASQVKMGPYLWIGAAH